MKGKWHFLFTLGFFIGLWFIFNQWLKKDYFTITQIIAAVTISFFPDIDQRFRFLLGHRNIFTHSIILWVIIYWFNPHFIYLMMVLAVGFHCLLDCRWRSKKQKGFYTIKIMNGVGIGGWASTFWLFGNFLAALGLFTYIMVVF